MLGHVRIGTMLLFLPSVLLPMPFPEIHTCVIDRDYEKLALVLRSGNPICNVNQYSYEGFTALHYAALIGDKRITKMLLRAGADISCKVRKGRYYGCSADQCASRAQHKSLSRKLKNLLLPQKNPVAQDQKGGGDGSAVLPFQQIVCIKPVPQLPLHAEFIAELIAQQESSAVPVQEEVGTHKRSWSELCPEESPCATGAPVAKKRK